MEQRGMLQFCVIFHRDQKISEQCNREEGRQHRQNLLFDFMQKKGGSYFY